jgi:3-oxoadipate enol-lactonase
VRAFVNGIALDFDLVGDGPSLVLVHALGLDRRMWRRQVSELAETFQVLAYDVRGHGRSDRPPGPYTLELLADDLRGLMDALGIERASLLGLSMGGMIAQTFALAYPAQVERLILADTTSEYPADGRRQFAERARLVAEIGIESIVQATLERWFTPRFRAAEPREVDEIRRVLLAADPIGYAGACLAVSRVDLTSRLGGIRCPTLVLVGERDPGTPVEAAVRIQQAIPGARLEVIADASHLSNVAEPEAFGDAVARFLTGQDAEAGERALDEVWDRPLPPDRYLGDSDLLGEEERGEAGDPSTLPDEGIDPWSGGQSIDGYSEEPRTDREVSEGVRSAFFLSLGFDATQFSVETVEGVVTIRGTVASDDERSRAVAIASEVLGVLRVTDELVVDPQGYGADPMASP